MAQNEIGLHQSSSDGWTLTSYADGIGSPTYVAQRRKNVQLAGEGETWRRRHRLIRHVFAYIDRNFREPIRLADVAASAGHVPAYLTDAIRNATGRPVHQWVAERRTAEARHLLATGDAPIAAVARAAGYDDAAYFARAFVRANGASPSGWRRMYRGRVDAGALDATAVARAYGHIVTVARALALASTRAERNALLLGAARTLVTLNVTMNHRDPETGRWFRHGSSTVAFTDDDASIPMLVHGCMSAELLLEHSYYTFYRRLAQRRGVGGFFKIPLTAGGVCIGALCATMQRPHELTREQRFILEELARAYNDAVPVGGG